MEASSAVCTSSVGIFLLSFFRWGGFLTLPRAKPDDIAGEAIDLSFQKCVGHQCNSLGCDGVAAANCESSSSIASAAVEDPFVQPVTALTRFSDRS
jgi:hypothetical protein